MAKPSDDGQKTAQKGKYICVGCKTEFDGTSCPECGTAKGNIRLAADGLDHDLHKTSHLFNAGNLRPTDDLMSDSRLLEQTRIEMQMQEMNDNLRESHIIKSKIKKYDQEMELKRKQMEALQLEQQSKEFLSGRSSAPPSQNQGQPDPTQQMPNMPLMNMSTMSPQAVFMQQLMRMDSKKRAEFIDQLSEADPGALANLSSMFQQAQPQNPYPQMGMNPANPYGQYPMMPPWMMQPQQQPAPQPQQSPIELVTAIFELSQKMAPQKDDSLKEYMMEFKNSMEKVHTRIDALATKERDGNVNPILEKINNLEQKINNGVGGKSVVDHVNELTSLVDGLEKAGLVKRSGSADKTIDDELKLKEFDFKVDMKNREIELEANKIEAERSKSDLTKNIVSTLLQRGIQKNMQARDDEGSPSSTTGGGLGGRRPAPQINRVRTSTPPEPVEIVSEVQSDSGRVMETRRPVKKSTIGGE